MENLLYKLVLSKNASHDVEINTRKKQTLLESENVLLKWNIWLINNASRGT